MMREGPIPRFLHGLVEYVAAGVLIAAPFVLSFESGAAVAVSIVAGVVVLFLASATEGPTSLINYVPLAAHVVLDYLLAGLLIAMPFIAGFSDESTPTAFFIVLGALHLLITIGTRFRKEERPEPREPAAQEAAVEEAEPLEEPVRASEPAGSEADEFEWTDDRDGLERPPEYEPPPERPPGERA